MYKMLFIMYRSGQNCSAIAAVPSFRLSTCRGPRSEVECAPRHQWAPAACDLTRDMTSTHVADESGRLEALADAVDDKDEVGHVTLRNVHPFLVPLLRFARRAQKAATTQAGARLLRLGFLTEELKGRIELTTQLPA